MFSRRRLSYVVPGTGAGVWVGVGAGVGVGDGVGVGEAWKEGVEYSEEVLLIPVKTLL